MPYQIPRNVKGEGRILYIFSTKALIYTGVGAGIGLALAWILGMFGLGFARLVIVILFGAIGYAVATFKIPNTTAFEFTKKTGGENIDDIIKRWIKFKFKNKNKIYVYTEEKTEIEK